MDYLIDMMFPQHWNQIKDIYIQGINTGNATFETEAPGWEEWNKSHISSCRIVARQDSIVLGWAALSSVSSRQVYAGVGEVSLYIRLNHLGKGIGTSLLKRLIGLSEHNGFWTLQASAFPENKASIKLHLNCGFRIVGTRIKIGKMAKGNWRDVILLERRSEVVATE